MDSSSSLIVEYEREAEDAISRIKSSRNRRELDQALEDAESAIESIKASVTSVPLSDRPTWRSRAAALEARVQEASRAALLERAGAPAGGPDARAVRCAESSVLKAASGVRKLEDSRRVLAETEDVASNVLEQLQTQTGDIERMRRRVHDMNEDLTMSQRILRRMRRWWA